MICELFWALDLQLSLNEAIIIHLLWRVVTFDNKNHFRDFLSLISKFLLYFGLYGFGLKLID
jgi:hypothetical protein